MCGLIGYFTSHFIDKDKNAFIDLLLMSQVRGLDSTGIIRLVQSDNKKSLYFDHEKEAVTASQFLYDRKYGIFHPKQKKSELYGILAHVRAATKGTVSEKNAHPFVNGKVVGMHNGTIHGWFEGSSKYDTDSEAIYALIAEFGIEEGLKKVNAAQGKVAYALQFYDHKTGDIHFIRNSERPLYMGWEKLTDTYMVASEKVFLKYVEEKYNFHFDRIILLAESKLYTLHKIGAHGFNFSEKTLDVKPKYVPPLQSYGGTTTSVANPSQTSGASGVTNITTYVPVDKVKWPTVTFLRFKEKSRVFSPFPPGSSNFLRTKSQNTPSGGGEEGASEVVDDHQDCKTNVVDMIDQQITNAEVFLDKRQKAQEAIDEQHAPFLELDRFSWDMVVASCNGCLYCNSRPHYSLRGKILWCDDDHFLCDVCKLDHDIVGALTDKEILGMKRIHGQQVLSVFFN